MRDQRPPGELIGRVLDAVWDRAQGITLESAKCRFNEDFEVDSVGLTMAWGEHSITVHVQQGSDPEAIASEIYDAIRLSMDPDYESERTCDECDEPAIQRVTDATKDPVEYRCLCKAHMEPFPIDQQERLN